MLHMDRFFWNSKDHDASLYPFRTDVRVQAFEQSSQVHPQSLFSQQTFSTIKIISFPGVTFNMTTQQPGKLGKSVVKSFPGQFCEGNSPAGLIFICRLLCSPSNTPQVCQGHWGHWGQWWFQTEALVVWKCDFQQKWGMVVLETLQLNSLIVITITSWRWGHLLHFTGWGNRWIEQYGIVKYGKDSQSLYPDCGHLNTLFFNAQW